MSDESKREIEINFSNLKKIFLKNNYVLVFSILAFLSLIFSLAGLTKINLGNFINNLTSLMPYWLWILLFFSFVISSVLSYFEKYKLMVLPLLIFFIILTVQIRTQNIPQLKDITTGEYTLGPDLDPWWYTRLAKEIIDYGKPINPDMMRAAPLGLEASYNLHSYLIAWFYKFLTIFDKNFDFMLAVIISPVVLFALATIFFFLFSRKVFLMVMEEKRANIAALIATAFFTVIPEMLQRTVAGIPEHEPSGIMFMFLAFWLFICAWESEGKKFWLLALGSGIATALMISTWIGAARYTFMIVGLAVFFAFLFGKIKNKEFFIYAIWFLSSIILAGIIFPDINSLDLLKSINDFGFTGAILGILILDKVLFETKLKEQLKKFKEKIKIKLPRSIISLIVVIVLGLIISLILKPNLIPQLFFKIIEQMLYPLGKGRIILTVAEARIPYLIDFIGNFSSIIFWIFFFSSIYIFYEAVKHFKNKKVKFSLIAGFIIFTILLLFSRYSPQSLLLNGENGISKLLYLAGPAIFMIILLYQYIKANQETLEDFKNINFSYLFILSILFFSFISIRGGIRLFLLISPFLVLTISYLPLKLSEYTKSKDETVKILIWISIIILSLLLLISFIKYEKTTSQFAKHIAPSYYNQQWQKAMFWVRTETPKNSIFAHWWDYGYWVQSIGERPTIVDGGFGNFQRYLMGRNVLTGQSETEALEFLYAHNTSYLLIDSTDIGKYSAYSSIGSDETGKDRLSWISTFNLDEKQTQKTDNETLYFYTGGTILDQDIIWKGKLFPSGKAGIGAFILNMNKENKINSVDAIFVYNNQQNKIPIRYIYINNELIDIAQDKEAINSTLYFIPRLNQQGINNLGGALYLSPKLMNSQMVKLYLLNQSENFELVHNEPALPIKQIQEQYNLNVGDFLLANDLYGPIKIWKINYPKNFQVSEEKIKRYLDDKGDLNFKLW